MAHPLGKLPHPSIAPLAHGRILHACFGPTILARGPHPWPAGRQCAWGGGSAGCEDSHRPVAFLPNQRASACVLGAWLPMQPRRAVSSVKVVVVVVKAPNGGVDPAAAPARPVLEMVTAAALTFIYAPRGARARRQSALPFVGNAGSCSAGAVGVWTPNLGQWRAWGAARHGRCRAGPAATATFSAATEGSLALTQRSPRTTAIAAPPQLAGAQQPPRPPRCNLAKRG